MSYYPKNRVKTNLYTEGKEYAIESTGQSYKGYYHKLYTGELFTGKTPSDLPVEKLIELPVVPGELHSDVNFTPIYTSEVAYGNLDYLNITNPSLAEKNLPYPIIPLPTPQDYQLGEFRRYFAKKINEIKFIEINKDTYDNLNSQNSSWLWELYQVFFIPWSISGDKQTVAKTNRNIVMLTMQRLNIYGFNKFLKENYTKFYQGSDLYTSGGEFKTADNKNYIGFYHIHSNIGPMVGKVHIKESHERLFPVRESNVSQVINPQIQITSTNTTSNYTLPTNIGRGGFGGGGGGNY